MTKANDKNMLKANKVVLHFENYEKFLGQPVLESQPRQCFIFLPHLRFLVFSFDLAFFIIDDS
jgi:hypothetical protein